MRVLRYLLTLIEGPDRTISTTRVLALWLGVVGCYVAVQHPTAWQTVSCLIGGGAVALLLRVKGGPSVPKLGPDMNEHDPDHPDEQ